jgi:hypothetical protein
LPFAAQSALVTQTAQQADFITANASHRCAVSTGYHEGVKLGIRLRAAASVILLVGFFALLAALLVTLVGGVIYALASGRVVGLKLAIGAVVVLVAVGAALRKVLQVKAQPQGALVERAEQPELWRMIDDLAWAEVNSCGRCGGIRRIWCRIP